MMQLASKTLGDSASTSNLVLFSGAKLSMGLVANFWQYTPLLILLSIKMNRKHQQNAAGGERDCTLYL